MAMRHLIAVACLAACTDPSPADDPLYSTVQSFDLPAFVPPSIDILIVVDDTAAMAPYQAQLADIASGAQVDLFSPGGPEPDTRILVTTTTGALRPPLGALDPYLAYAYDARMSPSLNVPWTFEDTLAHMLDVELTGSAPVHSLEAATRALAEHPSFQREHSYLAVVIVTASDDASPGDIPSYVAALRSHSSDPWDTFVATIRPTDAARLDALVGAFPHRGFTADIATADFANTLGQFQIGFRHHLALPCMFEPADVDPETAGPQYDCDVHGYYEDGSTQHMPQCTPGHIGPCFELVEAVGCSDALHFRTRGFPTRYAPQVRGQCVTSRN